MMESSSRARTRQMENIKDLFSSIRKGLENFSAHITHSTQIYKRKQVEIFKQLNRTNKLKDDSSDLVQGREASVAAAKEVENEEMVTTMGATLDNFVNVMLDMAKDVKSKADSLFRDLIEPSDLYCKHYSATNNILIEQARQIWQGLHNART